MHQSGHHCSGLPASWPPRPWKCVLTRGPDSSRACSLDAALPPHDAGQDRALSPLDDYSPCTRPGKNLLQLQNHALPWDLEREIGRFVDCFIYQRYHGSLDNVTPTDVYFGRAKEVLSRREEIKRQTLEARRHQHTQSLMLAA